MFFRLILGVFLFSIFSCNQEKGSKNRHKIIKEKDSLEYLKMNVSDLNKAFEKYKNDPKQTQERLERIGQYYTNSWGANQVSGGLLIGENGKIIFEKYQGYSNREKRDTLNQNSALHIASISKVLTASVVLKLIDEKLITLEQPVYKILPGFVYKDIRIIDLLTHRSGLPNYNYFPQNDSIWDMHTMQTNQSMFNALNAKLLDTYSPPDQNFSYCNTNYALLALVIEKVTGMSYPKAMKFMLFDPLKMDHTFVFNIKDSANVSQSYSSRNTRWKFTYLDNIYGDKNIYSTPRDLFQFDKALYSDDFLSKDIKEKMKKGYSYEHKGIKNYGLGIRLKEFDNGETLWYHNGWWHGNYSSYTHAEKEHVAIIALGNKQLRTVYGSASIVSLFGDYPLEIEEEVENDPIESHGSKDTIAVKKDTLIRNDKKK